MGNKINSKSEADVITLIEIVKDTRNSCRFCVIRKETAIWEAVVLYLTGLAALLNKFVNMHNYDL